MLFNKKENLNPVEKYLKEVRMSLLLDGYNLSNGVLVDPSASKEVLKEEMRRVEQYLAAKEEMNLTHKLR
jgi:hypothetical protein